MHHVTLQEFYLYAKVIGASGAAVSTVYGIVKYLGASYRQFKNTSDTVTLLATNHLPHIQKSLDDHGVFLTTLSSNVTTLSSDVRDVSTKVEGMEQRLDDTKKGVSMLGESFLRHLENTSRDPVRKKSRRI